MNAKRKLSVSAFIAGLTLLLLHAGAGITQEAVATASLLDFSAKNAGWGISLGSEFPGAKGGISVEKSEGGEEYLKLEADFTGGGRYVAITKSLSPGLALSALRLSLKSGGNRIGLRLGDASGQWFQQYFKLTPGEDGWCELAVDELANPARKDIYFWGGAKDGAWRGPATNITILLETSPSQPVNALLLRKVEAALESSAAVLLPVDAPQSLYVTAGESARLEWTTESGLAAREAEYEVIGFDGAKTGTGTASVENGRLRAELNLPVGFHEIVFPRLGKQTFGIVAVEKGAGEPDPFFGIDGAFGYFPVGKQAGVRAGYLRVLARCGISMQRERLGLSLSDIDAGVFRWSENARALRAEAQTAGVSLLEHFCVTEQRKPNPYPGDLSKLAATWREFASGLGGSCGGVEFWNEPDIFAGGLMPGDTYSALLKGINYLSAGRTYRLCGGVFNHITEPAFQTYTLNGLLANSDVFAYHDYTPPEKTEQHLERFRLWCAQAGHGGIPFWMTEAGAGWKRGPARAPRQEDAAGALDVVTKAVECKACGNERHFPFLLVFYEENKTNWGMHDKHHTPQRSMAAYAACARILAGAEYTGDLRHGDRLLRRARVFRRQDGQMVVACYLWSPLPGKTARLGLTPLRLRGLDGRELPVNGDLLPLDEGLVYAYVKAGDIAGRIDEDTTAARLTAQTRAGRTPLPAASPLIIMPQVRQEQAGYSPKGYVAKNPEDCTLHATLYNLGEREESFALELVAPEGVRIIAGGETLRGRIGAGGSVGLALGVSIEKALGGGRPLDMVLRNREKPDCEWGLRFVPTEFYRATRRVADVELSPQISPVEAEGWRLLAGEEYVPLGFVIYDGRTKVWFRCQWDGQGVYLDVLTEKPGFTQNWTEDKMWLGDSVQAAFSDPQDDMHFAEYAAALTPKGVQLYRHHSLMGEAAGLLPEGNLRVTRAGERVLYRLHFAAAELGLPALNAGMKLKFSLLINYNDGLTRAGYLHWGGGIAEAKSPAEYGILRLEE